LFTENRPVEEFITSVTLHRNFLGVFLTFLLPSYSKSTAELSLLTCLKIAENHPQYLTLWYIFILVCCLQEITSLAQVQSIPGYAAWHTDKAFWECVGIGSQKQCPMGSILPSFPELRGIRASFAFAHGVRALVAKSMK